ncbi:MAG: pantoate--beta-alanine ligase [Panacibacter sp.]
MIIFKESETLSRKLQQLKSEGKNIGFVPTMGALHPGHISLIHQSILQGDLTVVSIFVNPAQFNDKRDYEKYPISIETDITLLHNAGTDILFLPSVEEMYPDGLQSLPTYDLGTLDTMLEGHYRPGHFQGVCAIMHKLLDTVEPHHLYMGQKDYQQCMVIRKLIADHNLNTELNIVPTQREESGLAMSSRNMRLSPFAKQNASAIYNAHLFVKNNLLKLSFTDLRLHASSMMTQYGFEKIDYVEICNAHSLQPVTHYSEDQKLVILSAAFIEGIRLIDNLLLN